MSVAWHVLFWLMLPVSLYASLWAYGEMRRNG